MKILRFALDLIERVRFDLYMRKIALTICLFSACTSLNTELPELDVSALQSEQADQERAAFTEIQKLRSRLDKVASRVLRANHDLCEKTGPDTGIVTQTIKSFPKELREGAERELGLKSEPVIVYVRPGSVGESAGLKIGDQLLNEDGEPISVPSKVFNSYLNDRNPLNRLRDAEVTDITIEAPDTCYYPVRLRMSPAINAYATGKSIIVTAGMMHFVQSDDELAYIIGHELAHNTEDHVRKSITNYVLSLGGTRFTRPFESEADYVGLYYMKRAGYDSDGVEDFWRRLALQSLRPIGRAKTHPTYPTRTLLLQETRREMQKKTELSLDLLPERRGDDD